jgi:4-hydroxybenzoate polyprenyltransferase
MKKTVGYILAFSPVWGALLAITIISPKIGLIVVGGVVLCFAAVVVGTCMINDDWPWSN